MTTIPRPTRSTAKSARAAATRDALLAAARELFGSQGFANTSVDEVVRRAGLTKGALYHHFKDKDELFRAVVEEVKLEVTQRAAARYFETTESPDPIEAVRLTCFAVIDAYLDPAAQRIAVLDARSVLAAAVRRDLDNRYEVALLRGAFRSAMRAGMVERQPLVPLAHVVAGALTEACALIAEASDTETARQEVGEVITRLLNGLRPQD